MFSSNWADMVPCLVWRQTSVYEIIMAINGNNIIE